MVEPQLSQFEVQLLSHLKSQFVLDTISLFALFA